MLLGIQIFTVRGKKYKYKLKDGKENDTLVLHLNWKYQKDIFYLLPLKWHRIVFHRVSSMASLHCNHIWYFGSTDS